MPIVGGTSWVVEAARSAPVEPPARSEKPRQKPPRPTPWTPPAAQGRGLLIDLLV